MIPILSLLLSLDLHHVASTRLCSCIRANLPFYAQDSLESPFNTEYSLFDRMILPFNEE